MAAYLVFQGDVTDPETYERYKVLAQEALAAAGGRYLVRGGDVDVLEGEPPAGRTVVVEFPSRQAALDWYHGEEYQAAKRIRESAARIRFMWIVDGAPGA